MSRQSESTPSRFKVLRAIDHTVIGGYKPVQVAATAPKPVKFDNAREGLRLVNSAEVRSLAAASARRRLASLAKAKI